MKIKTLSLMATWLLLLSLTAATAFAQTTAFTYQGRLSEMGIPVTGDRLFRFALYDENGVEIPGASIEQTVSVANGVFNTTLDFGAGAFPGANCSLEIAVRINAGDPYTILSPRQPINSAPYSIKSLSATTADNATQLDGVDATRFVQADAGGNVSIAGGLTVGGPLSLDTVNAQTQYNLGGNRVLSAAGGQNLFVGLNAGRDNSTGNLNTFVGSAAGLANTAGIANSFFGANAGASNRTGGNNSFFGDGAGLVNVVGSGNSFFGTDTGRDNNSGSHNSFFGRRAGARNTTGGSNSFFGSSAGDANFDGVNNSFFGVNAGAANTAGSTNSFFGVDSGINNQTGNENVFVGRNAGVNNFSGSSNTFVGTTAGGASQGDFNTSIGANATPFPGDLSNATAIGANTIVSQSNSLVLGSINGVGNGTADTSVGIGTTAPKAKLDVTGGNVLVGSPGQGIILKSPDGGTCRLFSIDNAGAMVLTTVACP